METIEAPSSNAEKKFTSSYEEITCGEQKYSVRILKMVDSTMIFVSNADLEYLSEIGVALPIQKSETVDIIGTTLLGPHISSESQTMAEKLTKRFNRQIYVSYNANVDRMIGPLLEKKLAEYIGQHNSILV